MLWLKVHSHWLLRACLLGSKRKLPPPACQVQLGLPSLVCHPRVFPGTVYICSQGPLSSAWAYCISCAPSACCHCRGCCSCPLQCNRQCMDMGHPGAFREGEVLRQFQDFREKFWSKFRISLYILYTFISPSAQDREVSQLSWDFFSQIAL